MPASEGVAQDEGDDHHGKDDEGAAVGPVVGLHRLFDHRGEGEDTHRAEGEEQLEGQEAKHLNRFKTGRKDLEPQNQTSKRSEKLY